jgi:hypothetical protein
MWIINLFRNTLSPTPSLSVSPFLDCAVQVLAAACGVRLHSGDCSESSQAPRVAGGALHWEAVAASGFSRSIAKVLPIAAAHWSGGSQAGLL